MQDHDVKPRGFGERLRSIESPFLCASGMQRLAFRTSGTNTSSKPSITVQCSHTFSHLTGFYVSDMLGRGCLYIRTLAVDLFRLLPFFLPCSTPREKTMTETTIPIRALGEPDNLMVSILNTVLSTIFKVADVKPATDEDIEGVSSLSPSTVFNDAFNSVIFRCR